MGNSIQEVWSTDELDFIKKTQVRSEGRGLVFTTNFQGKYGDRVSDLLGESKVVVVIARL